MKIPQTKSYKVYKNLVLKDKRSHKLNFNPDGRKHYVYRITDKNRIIEENYYGSRTSGNKNIIDDFWKYRTSSKYNTILIEDKENYKVKIIKIFNNPGDKIIYEAFLHQYFNVKLRGNSFWNRSNQTPFGFDTTGTELSEEHKRKISETQKGKIISDEHRKIMSKTHKGKIVSSETRKKLSISAQNRTITDEYRKNMSNAMSKDNYQVAIIELYDEKGDLQKIVTEPFGKYCKTKGLPENMFKKSYKSGGTKIYNNPYGKSIAKNKGYEKYIGWYAIKKDKEC